MAEPIDRAFFEEVFSNLSTQIGDAVTLALAQQRSNEGAGGGGGVAGGGDVISIRLGAEGVQDMTRAVRRGTEGSQKNLERLIQVMEEVPGEIASSLSESPSDGRYGREETEDNSEELAKNTAQVEEQGGQRKRAATKMVGALGQLLASNVLLRKALQVTKGAFDYGNIVARGAAATNKQSILSRQGLSDQFGMWGKTLPEVGVMMESSMRAGVQNMKGGFQTLAARATGMGASMENVNSLLISQIEVLGRDTDATQELGNQLIDLGQSNNIYADAIIQAVVALQETVRIIEGVYGEGMGAGFEEVTAKLAAFQMGPQASQAIMSVITQTSPAELGKLRGAVDMAGGDAAAFGNQELTQDIAMRRMMALMSMTRGPSDMAGGTYGAGGISDAFKGLGLNPAVIQSIRVLNEKTIEKYGSAQAFATAPLSDMTEADRKTRDEEVSKNLRDASLAAQEAMLEFAAQLGMLNKTMAMTGFAGKFTQKFGQAFDILGPLALLGGGLNLLGSNMLGFQALLQTGRSGNFFQAGAPAAPGGMTPAQYATTQSRTAGGQFGKVPGGSIEGLKSGRAAVRSATFAKSGWGYGAGTVRGQLAAMDAEAQFLKASKAKLGGFRGIMQPRTTADMTLGTRLLRNPTAAVKATGAQLGIIGRGAIGMGKGSMRALGPLGTAAAGIMSYHGEMQTTGDKSRAATRAGGALGGGLVGAAAGAAMGSVVPIIGTAIGGILGGIMGSIAGESASVAIHDAAGFYEKDPATAQAAAARQQAADSAKTREELLLTLVNEVRNGNRIAQDMEPIQMEIVDAAKEGNQQRADHHHDRTTSLQVARAKVAHNTRVWEDLGVGPSDLDRGGGN